MLRRILDLCLNFFFFTADRRLGKRDLDAPAVVGLTKRAYKMIRKLVTTYLGISYFTMSMMFKLTHAPHKGRRGRMHASHYAVVEKSVAQAVTTLH